MRTVNTNEATPSKEETPTLTNSSLQTFSAILKDGREIVIREMTGRDLIYMEEELSKLGETRRSFHLMERLNVGEHKVSFEEIEQLGVRDIKAISELISKANGDSESEGEKEKDPN